MYRKFIERKFPQNDNLGLYVSPRLPGSKLGKILMKETRVKQPGDVMAIYLEKGFFGSSYLILTGTQCFFDGGMFDLETLRGALSDGKQVKFMITRPGTTQDILFRAGNEEAATIIAKVMDDLAYHDPEAEAAEANQAPEEKYKQFEGSALDWLLLRDEVMKTLDMLHEKFQDGKLSLIEYENKKADLLSRL